VAPKNDKDINAREQTTVDEARRQGIGKPEEGIALSVPSYTEDDGTSYLGVGEPVVPEPMRGETEPENEEGMIKRREK
jgi:hypothetical protein